MRKKLLLEICIETLEAAVAAERGGADRIELCDNLTDGGTTPSTKLICAVRGQVSIPVFKMIRPRAGDFCYSGSEFLQMRREIEAAKDEGVNGVVLGILTSTKQIDVPRTTELVALASPLPATFHRAFDESPELLSALDDVIATGAARILTSSGAEDALAGSAKLAELVNTASNRITIMPGGGIRPENLSSIVRSTGAREFHSGLSHLRHGGVADPVALEGAVRRLAATLN